MRIDGAREHAVLIGLGAWKVQDVHDDAGVIVAVEVEPEIDLTGYDAAFQAKAKADLLAYAASMRFRRETGGIVVAGQPVATDRESQALISGAYALVQAQPDTTIRFKTPSGFVTLGSTQMAAIAVAVAQHVQACFALEADIAGDIEAGEVTTLAAIDAAFSA